MIHHLHNNNIIRSEKIQRETNGKNKVLSDLV